MDKKENKGVEMYDDVVFHHKFPLQLRFFDADQFGHINNSIYFQYYDTAKMDYFERLGVPYDQRHVTVTAHIDADFLAQVYTSDTHIEVQSAVTHLGHKSFVFIQRLVDSQTGEVKGIGRSIIVAFDLETNKSVEIWPEWVDAIEKLRAEISDDYFSVHFFLADFADLADVFLPKNNFLYGIKEMNL